MSLIKSISGIRGTIGGAPGEGLSPLDIVKFTAAYATFIRRNTTKNTNLIVVGRDARVSGEMVSGIVVATLCGMGFDVVNIGLASTPTTEIAVTEENACGGIIITASHNPMQWNALKLLNENGEFLNDAQGKEVLAAAEADAYTFCDVMDLGHELVNTTYDRKHIEKVLALDLVDTDAISKANFTVAVDAVNSVGGTVIPQLLRALGVKNIIELNCEVTGRFSHTPEPIPENLTQISSLMRDGKADVGFVVDPDVDRLAIVMENGDMFVEEYTLVAVADYVLSHTPGATVSNLSSSRALRDITAAHGCQYAASAVGEVNVTTKMKETGAVIGGEGNGGVIYPASHYGRDALVGVALFLSLLAKSGKKVSELKKTYPAYAIAKNKIELTPEINVDAILEEVKKHYASEKITDVDGVKIDFADSWVHLRKSNTEPIIRIYSEAHTMQEAEQLGQQIKDVITEMTKH
ncbi:phosphoglucosamine mutase [Paramuribaculum intestinale]|uniref:Phosphoglucosamine mutase n=1 Tax=Paramuribaculum intestinale TaxID=2094151 RepID=A0A2V1J152_9BACT|nr:phosphoglucosamine mutase [Paramuribaculum intestinale]MBJ2185312.1 phosphoglucosamine mutase [Muribaculaceae bacterium]PWB09725.1 phosphoglucosamine mutase [Paramuribaculum intestinale]PWB10737.1 phosphoglucosamine mutase [Paramuribaculum intestinale]WLT43023.1 phosphoglucosamine mutase [Paramuribaculum intestinale]